MAGWPGSTTSSPLWEPDCSSLREPSGYPFWLRPLLLELPGEPFPLRFSVSGNRPY